MLACLAWLLLVVVPVHGESMAMPAAQAAMAIGTGMSGMGMGMQHSSADGVHAAHAVPRHANAGAGDCCSGADDHDAVASCHCAAPCSTALTADSMLLLSPLMPERAGDPTGNASAPDGAHRPPLRPPAA